MSENLQIRSIFLSTAVSFACLFGMFSPISSTAQTKVETIPMELEPNHKIRFDNGKVRLYEVNIPKGGATLMHEHRADNFLIIFEDTEITNDLLGGKPALVKFPAGSVRFTSTANGEYSHRVIVSGEKPLHLIAMELLSIAPKTTTAANPRRDPPFNIMLENSRARVYKITLAPGESTDSFIRPAGAVLFAISSGRIRERTDSMSERLWDFESGNFKWFETSEKLSLKNESNIPIDLVEVDVF